LLSTGLVAAATSVRVRMHHAHSAAAVSDHWPMSVTISFPPGDFTGDESKMTRGGGEGGGEYWTSGRVCRVALELTAGVVFCSGTYVLARGNMLKKIPTSLDSFFGFGMGSVDAGKTKDQ